MSVGVSQHPQTSWVMKDSTGGHGNTHAEFLLSVWKEVVKGLLVERFPNPGNSPWKRGQCREGQLEGRMKPRGRVLGSCKGHTSSGSGSSMKQGTQAIPHCLCIQDNTSCFGAGGQDGWRPLETSCDGGGGPTCWALKRLLGKQVSLGV